MATKMRPMDAPKDTAAAAGAPAAAATESAASSTTTPTAEARTVKTFVFPDGAKYVGECRVIDGKVMRDGLGEYTSGTERYVGSWKRDAMDGPGKYFFSSGAVYDGTFHENQMHGEGTYRWPKDVDEPQLVAPQADAPSQHTPKVVYQATYTGGWQSNRMHGNGAYTDAAGVKWEGQFHNGSYHTGHSRVVLNK